MANHLPPFSSTPLSGCGDGSIAEAILHEAQMQKIEVVLEAIEPSAEAAAKARSRGISYFSVSLLSFLSLSS